MRSIASIIISLTLFTTPSCTDEGLDPTTTDVVIIEGYLYAGQGIQDIKVSQLIPFITDEEETFEIADASVMIETQGQQYLLTHDPEAPGTYYYEYYEGADLEIVEGQTYRLSLEYFGKMITAASTVPSSPTGMEISTSEVEIAPILSFEDIFDRPSIEAIEIYWDNPTGDYYYVLVENIEVNPQDINQLDLGDGRNFSFVTEPTNLDVHNIRPFSLSQYGSYRVVLFQVGQEYVNLYETAEQDSRNLTEPISNVENGLGIFTSFNSDTVYFEVKRP